jgi:type II secretory pathway pseudopilin PulG
VTRDVDGRGGFTYLEVLLAGVLLAGTMTSMGYALANSSDLGEQQRITAQGRYLLQDGIAWLRMLARVDATDATGFGMEAGEATINDIDDVDDLRGVVEVAPTDRAGVAAGADWQRSWTVVSADLTTPTTDAANGSTALLRVGLTITYQGRVVTGDTLLLSRTP